MKIACILFTNNKNFSEKFLPVALGFEVLAIFSEDKELINQYYKNIKVNNISNFSSLNYKNIPYLVTDQHPHSYCKKYKLSTHALITPKVMREQIVSILNANNTSSKILAINYFDYFYLESACSNIDKEQQNLSITNASMCKLKQCRNPFYIYLYFFKIIWLFTRVYLKKISNRFHTKIKLENQNNSHKNLLLWNMVDIFFLDQIYSSTNFENYTIRIIDTLKRLSFPRLLLHYCKLNNIKVCSYEPEFKSKPFPCSYYHQTFSINLANTITKEDDNKTMNENGKKISSIFLGVCDQTRATKVYNIKKLLDRINEYCSIKLFIDKNTKLDPLLQEYVVTNWFDYNNYLKMLPKLKVLIEIMRTNHQGMTLRAMEALFFKKKLITNNLAIKAQDFYSKDNIFILGEDNTDNLSAFINSPFDEKVLNPKIVKKYTTEEFIKQICELND